MISLLVGRFLGGLGRRAILVTSVLAVLGGAPVARAQTGPLPLQAVLVEHFTNTRCSICRSRNPGFYANLRQQPGAPLHIAYHPSSPYSGCVFSRQNPTENDARTNFYGIYGGTPRLVLNGTVIPAGQDYTAPALFAPFQGLTSPLAVQTTLYPQGPDSLTVTVRILAVAPHTLSGLTLYVPLSEDTVFYAAPNGEALHFDVFRKAFAGAAPEAVAVPAFGDAPLTLRRTISRNPAWAVPRLRALAIIQQPGGAVVQVAAAPLTAAPQPQGLTDETGTARLRAYPNPVRDRLYLEAAGTGSWQVLNVLGRVVASGAAVPPTVDASAWPAGAYVLRVAGQPAVRVVKE